MGATKEQLIAGHISEVLKHLGLNPEEPGLVKTPMRVAQYLMEFNQPFNPKEIIGDGFEAVRDGRSIHSMVVQSNIPFRMLCEHHLAPAIGRASFGYVPDRILVGLSKLTRLIQAVGTERPSLQEVICDRVADVFNEHVSPKGVIVVISGEHTCMTCRGINAPGVITTSSAIRGVFRDVPQARAEFFSLIGK